MPEQFRLRDWVERLEGAPGVGICHGSFDEARARGRALADGVYLAYADDQASPNRCVGGRIADPDDPQGDAVYAVSQEQETGVAAMLRITDWTDRRGEGAAEKLEELRTAVRRRLVGWQPPGAVGPIVHVRGVALPPRDGERAYWWLDLYVCPQSWRNVG